MIYSRKLSLMSSYCIQKILLKRQNIFNQTQLLTESKLDLERILSDLYYEKSIFENCINHLEILARRHQVLLAQKTTDTIYEVENQIFKILGFSSDSLRVNQENEYREKI